MSGSMRGFRYLTDSGDSTAIIRDESNTELVNSGIAAQATFGGLKKLFQGYAPRHVILEDATGRIRRKAVVLLQTEYAAITFATNYLATAANFSGVSEDTPLFVVQKVPEKITRQVISRDTGLNDGDNP